MLSPSLKAQKGGVYRVPPSVVVFWVMMSYQVLTRLVANWPAWLRAGRNQLCSPFPLCSPVFNGSVLCPYAILNEQQGVACQDPLPAARHSGTARKQLGPPQGFHRQRTKDDQPDPPGRSEGVPGGGRSALAGPKGQMLTSAVLCALSGFGCFHPSTHVSGHEDGLLPGKPLHTQPSEAGQRDAGRVGRHVWADARSAWPPSFLTPICAPFVLKAQICAFSRQAVGSEPARGSFRTGTHPRWDAIAPTRSSMATGATLPLPRSRSLTWGQSLLSSPPR